MRTRTSATSFFTVAGTVGLVTALMPGRSVRRRFDDSLGALQNWMWVLSPLVPSHDFHFKTLLHLMHLYEIDGTAIQLNAYKTVPYCTLSAACLTYNTLTVFLQPIPSLSLSVLLPHTSVIL